VIRFAPVLGLVLAAPVVADALSGNRSVDEALTALLVGMAAAAIGLHLLGLVTRVVPGPRPPAADDDEA
jgi:hypothetical protein